MITPVITSGIGGQPGTLIIGLPDTTEDTETVFVGFGFAACIPPQEAQEPYSMIDAAPLAASNRDSLNVRPPTVQ